jgi:hypothetical protein
MNCMKIREKKKEKDWAYFEDNLASKKTNTKWF